MAATVRNIKIKSGVKHSDSTTEVRKPQFDKKKWRQNKFKSKLGNVKEGQGFADERKRNVVKQYRRMMRAEQPQLEQLTERVQRVYNEETDSLQQLTSKRREGVGVKSDITRERSKDVIPVIEPVNKETKHKISIFKKAQLDHQQRLEESNLKKEKFQKDKEARESALKQYKEKKQAKNRVLLKKTKKGQPLMKPRLQMLLEEIKMQVAREKL